MSTWSEVKAYIKTQLEVGVRNGTSVQNILNSLDAIINQINSGTTDPTISSAWDPAVIYPKDVQPVIYNDEWFVSNIEGNEGIAPTDANGNVHGSWRLVSSSSGGIEEWAAQVYVQTLEIVFHTGKLYYLDRALVGTDPFSSTDFAAELTAAKWVLLAEVATASNVGTGKQAFKQKNGSDFEFRTFVAGPNATVTEQDDTITVNAVIYQQASFVVDDTAKTITINAGYKKFWYVNNINMLQAATYSMVVNNTADHTQGLINFNSASTPDTSDDTVVWATVNLPIVRDEFGKAVSDVLPFNQKEHRQHTIMCYAPYAHSLRGLSWSEFTDNTRIIGSGDGSGSGGSTLAVQDEGTTLTAGGTAVNFIGEGVAAAYNSTTKVYDVEIPGGKVTGVYYVSNSGLATNTGATESSAITPAKLLELIPSFTGGEKVYLKRGETFDLQIDLPKGGQPGNRTVFDAYGVGVKPIIRGSEDIGGLTWTEEGAGSGLWYAPLAAAPKWVFIGGRESKWAETPWHSITSQGTNTITSSSLVGAYPNTLVGATLILKEYSFRLSYPYTVTAWDSVNGVVTLDRNVSGGGANFGFKLYNQKQFINDAGEWWYDSTNSRLYVKAAATPAGTDIRVGTKDYGINLNAVSDVEVKNIKFIHQKLGGVRLLDAHRISVLACDFSDIRKNGVDTRGICDDLHVIDCDFLRMGMNGISGAAGERPVITGNTLNSIGMAPNYGIQEDTTWWKTSGSAIVSCFDQALPDGKENFHNGIIRDNKIDDVGYMGVQWYGSNHLVEYNQVSNFCKRFIDGAGIYSYSNPPAYGVAYNTGCVWRKNICFDGQTGTEGIPADYPRVVWGFYVDNGNSGFVVEDNVSYRNPYGGMLINYFTEKTTLRRNVVFGGGTSQIKFSNDDDVNYTRNVGNILEGNILVSTAPTQNCLDIESYDNVTSYNPFEGGGTADKNYYINLYTTEIAVYRPTALATGTKYTLDGLKSKYSGIEANGRNLVNKYGFSNADAAAVENLILVNKNPDAIRETLPIGYNDTDFTSVKRVIIPDHYAETVFKNAAAVTAIFEDNFVDANGTEITLHTPDTGAAWTVYSGAHSIQSNQLVTTTDGVILNAINTADGIYTAEVMFDALNSLSLYVRWVDINNRIAVNWNSNGGGEMKIVEVVSGVATTIQINADVVQEFNTRYILRIEFRAGQIDVYLNDLLKLTGTTSLTAAGSIGISGNTSTKYEYAKVVQ